MRRAGVRQVWVGRVCGGAVVERPRTEASGGHGDGSRRAGRRSGAGTASERLGPVARLGSPTL